MHTCYRTYDRCADDTNIEVRARSRWSLNEWVLSLLLKTESDSAVLTLVGSSFHHWGSRTEKSHDFTQWHLFSLSDGSPSWPADVEERSVLTWRPVSSCRLRSYSRNFFVWLLALPEWCLVGRTPSVSSEWQFLNRCFKINKWLLWPASRCRELIRPPHQYEPKTKTFLSDMTAIMDQKDAEITS